MHSTVSMLQDGRVLLIGGRLSPLRLCTQIVSLDVKLPYNSNPCEHCDNLKDNSETSDNKEHAGQVSKENCKYCLNSASPDQNICVAMETTNPTDIDCDNKESVTKHAEVVCTVVEQNGDIPCPRWRHSAVVYNHKGNVYILHLQHLESGSKRKILYDHFNQVLD